MSSVAGFPFHNNFPGFWRLCFWLGVEIGDFLQKSYYPIAFDACHDVYGEPGTHSRSAVNP